MQPRSSAAAPLGSDDDQDGPRAPSLTHTGQPTSDNDRRNTDGPLTVLWGTYVTMGEAMSLFKTFLRDFKIKYRKTHDEESGLTSPGWVRSDDLEKPLYEH